MEKGVILTDRDSGICVHSGLQYHNQSSVPRLQYVTVMLANRGASLGKYVKSAQSVTEELIAADTVHVLGMLSVEEQLEEKGATPRRPGKRRGKEEEKRGRRIIHAVQRPVPQSPHSVLHHT